jgi:hypothetical protein
MTQKAWIATQMELDGEAERLGRQGNKLDDQAKRPK